MQGGSPASPSQLQRRIARRRGNRPGRFVIGLFGLLVVLGTGLLLLPGMRADGGRVSVLDALFTATSAVTVTGLNVLDPGTAWTGLGQAVILLLIQVGGFGITTLGVLLVLFVSRRLGLRTRLITQAETPWLAVGDVTRVVRGVAVATLTIEALLTVALAARLRWGYGYDVGSALWYGLFHVVSAFNNAGFALWSDSVMGFVSDPVVVLTLCAAIVIGGIGFPVLFELRRAAWRPSLWSLHTRLTLGASAAFVVGGFALITWFEWTNPGTFGPQSVGTKLLNGLFCSVSPRTAGFNSIDYADATDSTVFTTTVLMFVGGGSASTAGGIKVTTFVILGLMVLAEARGTRDVIAADRRISSATQRTAVAVTLISMAAVAVSTFVMIGITDASFVASLFEVVSALSTTGLSLGITAMLNPVAQVVLIVLMFVGRLGPVTMASALAVRDRGSLYRLPEGRPIVG